MSLRESLKGARIIMTDDQNALTLAWFGGHGIYAYNDAGEEVAFWNTGSFAQNDASEEAVKDSMEWHIQNNEYPS